MSQNRINEIEKEIQKLNLEKEKLEAIERIPLVERKIQKYLDGAYSAKELMAKNNLDDFGLWKIKGEDPNCDMGGYHHEPDLGIFEGTLKEALSYAVEHPDFYSWGGGGRITKVSTIKS
jgi:hypothetical protein